MKVRVGTSGYSYKEWKGSFYPAKLPAHEMLPYYAARFGTVEINNSFYRTPPPAIVAGWAQQTPEEFSFVLKAPRFITHFARLKDVGEPVARFLELARALGPKQGPLLFQLPPNFEKDLPRLAHLLGLVPPTVRAAIEFRNPTWFTDDVYAALRARNVALCAVEDLEVKTPLVATASFGYLRLRDVDCSDAELGACVDTIVRQPWDEAWVFIKHDDEGRGPALGERLLSRLARSPKPARRRPQAAPRRANKVSRSRSG